MKTSQKTRPAILLIIVLAAIDPKIEFCRGLEKHWLGYVDWENPNNWQERQLPELDSRVIFPIEMRHAVGMPRIAEFRITGLELSRDGVVALPEEGKVTINERNSHEEGKISRWLRETTFFWVDPLNWNTSSEAVPHMERLPCQDDVVVLPASSRVFSMRLPQSRIVEVSAVRLEDDNETMARWEWRTMGERDEFIGSSFSVKYSPLMGCENCGCQEGDLSNYWEEICNVQRPRCGFPACEYPLEVEGHCCYYCGGRIRLSKKTLFSTAYRVAIHVLKGYEGSLFWHLRPTWDGYSEILITEKGTYGGTDTIIAVTEVESALKEEQVEVLYSETSGGPLYDYRLAVALGPFIGGFFVLLLLLLLLFPTFGYTISQLWEGCREVGYAIFVDSQVKGGKRKSFAFARFENISEGNVQLAEEEETRVGPSIGERFENPLYRLEKESKSGRGREKKLEPNEPVSLVALEKAIEPDQSEDIEMDIENL